MIALIKACLYSAAHGNRTFKQCALPPLRPSHRLPGQSAALVLDDSLYGLTKAVQPHTKRCCSHFPPFNAYIIYTPEYIYIYDGAQPQLPPVRKPCPISRSIIPGCSHQRVRRRQRPAGKVCLPFPAVQAHRDVLKVSCPSVPALDAAAQRRPQRLAVPFWMPACAAVCPTVRVGHETLVASSHQEGSHGVTVDALSASVDE